MARFLGRLGMEQLIDAACRPQLTSDGRSTWELTRPLSFETDDGEMITAPVRFHTDLGSIPRFAWSFGFSPDGAGTAAFVIHDFLYATRGTGLWAGFLGITRAKPYDRGEADHVLKDALGVCGAPHNQREAIFEAVRMGGGGGWGS